MKLSDRETAVAQRARACLRCGVEKKPLRIPARTKGIVIQPSTPRIWVTYKKAILEVTGMALTFRTSQVYRTYHGPATIAARMPGIQNWRRRSRSARPANHAAGIGTRAKQPDRKST